MTEITPEHIVELRRLHRQVLFYDRTLCYHDQVSWPCTVSVLLDALEEARNENSEQSTEHSECHDRLTIEIGHLAQERDRLREALQAAKDWWDLGHTSCEWCTHTKPQGHLPNCPGPLVDAALAASPEQEGQ